MWCGSIKYTWDVNNIKCEQHYDDVIMTTIASQITSLTVVYSIVYSDADERKHQSSASLAFLWEIHRDRWIPRTKGQLRGKCFHLTTSSWNDLAQISTVYRLLLKYDGQIYYDATSVLTHLPVDKKMATISQTRFPNTFSWRNNCVFWFEFH